MDTDAGPDLTYTPAATVVFNYFKEAQSFYQAKSNANKGRVKFFTRTALVSSWIGGSLLALSAYNLLLPFLSLFGMDSPEHALHLFYNNPQAAPTLMVAFGVAAGAFMRRRGYFRAQARYGLALSKARQLEASYTVALKVCAVETAQNQLAQDYVEKLVTIIGEERKKWAEEMVEDFSNISRITANNS